MFLTLRFADFWAACANTGVTNDELATVSIGSSGRREWGLGSDAKQRRPLHCLFGQAWAKLTSGAKDTHVTTWHQ